MKKIVLAALAASVLATPAAAQSQWQGKTYGQDAVGWYDLSAQVNTFCKFGTSNRGASLSNSTVDTNAYGGANEADGRFVFDIQNDNDNTVQGAQGRYDIDYAVCNTPFTMTVQSTNGGLKSANETSDEEFIELVPYNVHFIFDGIGNEITVNNTAQTVGTSNEARAGNGQVWVRVDPRDDLLLQGSYTDKLIVSVLPNLGGPAA